VGFVSGGFVKKKGRVSNDMIHVSDWFPTLVNLAGGNYEGVKPLDGFERSPNVCFFETLLFMHGYERHGQP
jgi:arylsulfatase A-like enzyme